MVSIWIALSWCEQAERVAVAAPGEALRGDRQRARVGGAELQGHRGTLPDGRGALPWVDGRDRRAAGLCRWTSCAALLEERRAELLGRIEQFGASDPAETSNLNFGKRIGDGTTYAVERMTGAYQARTLYETVKEIDQALRAARRRLIRPVRVVRRADPG